MKTTTSVLALAATLLPIVFASPMNIERDAEVEIEYKVVTNYEVVTAYATAYATEGEAAPVTTSSAPAYVAPAPAPEPTTTTVTKGRGRKWGYRKTKTTSTTQQAEPTTSSTPPPPPPPPPPTTTSTPEPTPEPTYEAPSVTYEAPAPTTESPTSAAPAATSEAYVAPPAYTPAQVTPTATTGDDSYSDANLQAAILQSTNQYRSEFQAAPLTWNQSLTDMAYKSAQLCDFEHSNAGQNLAAGYSGPAGAVAGWGDEYKSFDFSNPDFSETCGHFTQLVWQDSTTVGCAAKKCPTNTASGAHGWYLICNYFPVGNMLGEFKENVKSKAS